MFLEEKLEKGRNNLEKSEKERSRHGKGQALRTQEESHGVLPKQNHLKLNKWVP